LNSTTNITLGGIYWDVGSPFYVGQFKDFVYNPNEYNVTRVNISYAQVAYCRLVLSAADGF